MSGPCRQPAARGRIRRAESQDLERLGELWILLSEHHRAFDPLFQLRRGAASEIRQLLAATLRDRQAAIFVCEVAEDLIGFCSARIDRAPPIFEELVRGEILDLVVRPEWRRAGVGASLARASLAWIHEQGVERVEVRVAPGNAEGQAFWRRLGFTDAMQILQRRG